MFPDQKERYFPKIKKFSIPNLQEEAEMLEWAGISFGEDFTYKLGKSIKVSKKVLFDKSSETCNYEWSH